MRDRNFVRVARRSAVLGAVAGAFLLSKTAWAQSPTSPAPLSGPEVTLAETLYREGRQLMSEQRYEAACAKFAESNRLDPATGTLLNLAACLEASGKLASAWVAFGEALRASRRDGRQDRVDFAESRLAALEPRLSRLIVEVSAAEPTLVVKLDGVVIGPAAYGVATPIDPGAHRVEATAPGSKPWSREITISAPATQERVLVPKLEAEAAPAPREFAPPVVALPPAEPARERARRPVPVTVYVAGGAALAFGAAAVVSGVSYLNQRKEYDELPRDPSTRAARADKYDSARTAGWFNAGFSAAALLSASAALYFWISRPEEPKAQSAVVSPWIARDGLGLHWGSAF